MEQIEAPAFTAIDFGTEILNLGNDIDPSTAVYTYGSLAGVQAIVPLVLYLTLVSIFPRFV